MEEFRQLKERWGSEQIALLCGANGGLKDGVCTIGYVITVPEGASPLVQGRAAEQVTFFNVSSMRQELLAQLVVEYWLRHLVAVMGLPGYELQV